MAGYPQPTLSGSRRARSRRNLALIIAGLILLGVVATVAVLGTTGFGLFQDLQRSRTAITAAIDTVEGSGFTITADESQSVAQRLAEADALLARSEDTLRHDPLLGALGAFPPIGVQVDAALALVQAGRALTAHHPAVGAVLEGYIDARDSGFGAERVAALARALEQLRPQTDELLAALEESDRLLDEVPVTGLLGPLASAREMMAQKLDEARPLVDAGRTASAALPAITGVGGDRRYLVLALDNAEIRPIGGLIGAFATPVFVDGELRDFVFKDILSIDHKDQEQYVQPPEPLADHLLGSFTWQVADAGWWPDFAASVAEVRRMYQIETGEDDFQGVIAFTPEFVDRLLAVVGPVEVPEAGITVHPGETYLVSLEQVEVLNQGEGRKAFLADFAAQVLDRLFALPPSDYPALIAALDQAGQRRQLQVLFDDPADQAVVDALGWPGPFTFSSNGDRLAIMETNVAPISKLDVLLTMDHVLDVQLGADGSATERLVTTYRNGYGPDMAPALERVRSTFFGGFLGSYSRRYLVPDAILTRVSSDHPEEPITDPDAVELESGSLAVGNYQIVDPGSVRLTTEYIAPRVVEPSASGQGSNYRLDFRKQAGRDRDTITVRVAVPDGMEPTSWSEGGAFDDGAIVFHESTEFDHVFEVTYKPQ